MDVEWNHNIEEEKIGKLALSVYQWQYNFVRHVNFYKRITFGWPVFRHLFHVKFNRVNVEIFQHEHTQIVLYNKG